MSLIGDAVREAERAQGEPARRPSKPLGTIVVPPRRHRSRARPRLVAVAGISVVTGASAVGAGILSLRTPSHSPTSLFAERELSAAPVRSVHQAAEPRPATATKPPADSLRATPRAVASPADLPVVATPAKSRTPPAAAKPVADFAKPAPPREVGPLPPAPEVALWRSSKPVPPPPALDARDSLFSQAYLRQASNDLAAARPLYEQALASGDAPAAAYNDFGMLLRQLGEQSTALDMFRQATVHDARSIDAWTNLGDQLVELGRPVDALTVFARADQLAPARVDVALRLARAYQAVGDTTAAEKVFERAVATHPDSPAAHYALGQVLQARHEIAAAIRQYQRFVELAPSTHPADAIAAVKGHIAALRNALR